MIPNIGEIKFIGVELENELPLSFPICESALCIQIRYKENPSSRGHRGWRTLEAIQTSEYWINEERGLCDHYIIVYLRETFEMCFPNDRLYKSLSNDEKDQLFKDVVVEIKKILHKRKIEIPGYTIETGDEE